MWKKPPNQHTNGPKTRENREGGEILKIKNATPQQNKKKRAWPGITGRRPRGKTDQQNGEAKVGRGKL